MSRACRVLSVALAALTIGCSLPSVPAQVTMPVVDLGVGSIDVQPGMIPLGLPAILGAVVTNHGEVAVPASVAFYRGDPDHSGSLIGQTQTMVPLASKVEVQMLWIPNASGATTLFVEVTALQGSDARPTNDRAARTVFVDAGPPRLAVECGTATGWPGARLRVPASLQNVGSSALTITGSHASRPWLTLSSDHLGRVLAPGEGTTILLDVDVPLTVIGAPPGQAPIVHFLTLTVQTTVGSFRGDLVLGLHDQAPAVLDLELLDAVNGLSIGGVRITASGFPGESISNGVGLSWIPVPTGPREFFAYRSGWSARSVALDVAPGSPHENAYLSPGATFQVQQITRHLLSPAEIAARGIQVLDPVNDIVVDFRIQLAQSPPMVLASQEIPLNPSAPYTVGGDCVGLGPPLAVSGMFLPHAQGAMESWVLTPGHPLALGEFFEATIYVVNDAVVPTPQDLQLQGAYSSFSVPAGLHVVGSSPGSGPTLLFLGAQLDAGSAAQASLGLRADRPGDHALAISTNADLQYLGQPLGPLSVTGSSRPAVVTPRALRLDLPEVHGIVAGSPFDLEVRVINEQSTTVPLVRVSLDDQLITYATLAANQPSGTQLVFDAMGQAIRAEVDLGDIAPGQVKRAPFRLLAERSGRTIPIPSRRWNTSTPRPSVIISPDYPGVGDLAINSGTSGQVDGHALHLVHPGESVTALISSPGGSLTGQPFWMGAAFYSGVDAPREDQPGLWLYGHRVFIPEPFGPLAPTGRLLDTTLPLGLEGLALLIQAVSFSPATTLGYVTSDAQVFRLLP
ncbi:MAG: hypothetical protein KDB53_04270 [Planctomycetes bacterium]|nr:hypothetical protein [Planctomycetota bacterium]